MDICTTKVAARRFVRSARVRGETVGLVPTMGFLHDGHMALVRAAVAACDKVIVSIFVNPTQFGANEDLDTYPRNEARDLKFLKAADVHAVFMPTPNEMYHAGDQTIVETTKLSKIMIGKIRPGHFRGVATVVCKLLNIVQPDQAFFGEKDFQQLRVIKTMVRDLDMPYEINGVTTVREADGLAMSSRNVKLTAADRKAAVILSASLAEAAKLTHAGITARALDQAITRFIAQEPRADVQSVDVRDADSLAPLRGRISAPAAVLLAVRFGDVLLIDQRVVEP